MGYGADSPGASEDSGLEDYDWDDVAAHLFSRGSLLSLVLIAFLATRFWLLSEFTASGTDAILYGGFARLGVDCGQIPYRDFEIEYPPVAWWLMAAPRVMASERYALPTLLHTTTWEFLANYFWWFHLELFIADTLCLGMMFLVGGPPSCAAQGVLPAAYVALSAAQPNLIYDRLDIVLLLFSLLCAYCWLRSPEASPFTDRWACASYLFLGLGISFKIMPALWAPFCYSPTCVPAKAPGG